MTSRSKAKGNGAERELCRFLGEVFSGSFTRVPNSGAITGGKNAARKALLSDTQIKLYKGDIITPDFLPKLVLESKFYKDFRFHQLLTEGNCPQLDTWVAQALDAVDEGDLWLVCFKINLRGWYVAVAEKFWDELSFSNHAVYTGPHGPLKVTALEPFVHANRDVILRLGS